MSYYLNKLTSSSIEFKDLTAPLTVLFYSIPSTKDDPAQVPVAYEPTVIDVNGDAVVPVASTYTLSNLLAPFSVQFGEDGVYKIEVNATYLHLFINIETYEGLIQTSVIDSICCSPLDKCDCNEKCESLYNFNVLALLGQTLMSDEIDINFNYGEIGSGYLFNGYDYLCTTADGGSPPHWQYGTTDILTDINYVVHPDTTSVVENTIYKCIFTGIPDDYDGATFTALTTTLQNKLNYIADALARLYKYNSECDNNPCSC